MFGLIGDTGFEVPKDNFDFFLSQVAEDEMDLITRLQRLREATEGLPEDWEADGIPSVGPGEVLTKESLLEELKGMEFQAASRWNIILKNLANLRYEGKEMTGSMRKQRQQLAKVRAKHQRINRQLDQVHARLKDGIIQNLAHSLSDQQDTELDDLN